MGQTMVYPSIVSFLAIFLALEPVRVSPQAEDKEGSEKRKENNKN